MVSFTRVFPSFLATLLWLSIIFVANGENAEKAALNVTDESIKEGDDGMEEPLNGISPSKIGYRLNGLWAKNIYSIGGLVNLIPQHAFTNPNILLKEGPNDQQLSAETLKELLNARIFLNGNESSGNGKQSPMRKKQKTKPPELSCNPQEKSLCANARLCVHRENSTNFECICHRGYGGRFCQFSLFPRSCADALAFHEEEDNELEGILPNVNVEEDGEHENGQWRQLDIDGSGPLTATFAECFANGGRTIVGHNIPLDQPFLVRNETFNNQSAFYPISYKLFSNAHLRALIDRSEHCRQTIRFDCEQSPLDFKNNQTWLQIAHREGQQFRQIGSQPFSCACRDKELYGCGRDEFTCYCDDLSQQSATDQAILHNKSAAVTAIYLRKNEMQFGGKQWITLGPLECAGEAGTSQNALVTLRSLSAHLETGAFHGWRQLEMDFRTWQPDIEKMVTGWSPVGNGEMQLKISLRAGHRIELTLSHQNVEDEGEGEDKTITVEDEEEELEVEKQQKRQPPQMRRRQPEAIRREMTISIASPRPLNDLFWHRLHLEMFRNEVRFSIDRLNAFQPLTFPFPAATKFTLGGDEQGNGFVGCVGNFRVDQRLVDWRSQLELRGVEDERVAPGCADLCQENQCQQGARCVEHFDTQTNDCECRQPRIHFGEHCEKNVNENSSIALDGTGFLRFENLALSTLHSDLVFSARTDQRRALFLYEHDELDNFVQIHLADEYRIVLSLNNLNRILHCTIYAKMGKVFNNMEWMQFVLERDGHGTISLNVEDQNCQIGGPILMNANGKEIRNLVGENGGKSSEEYEDAILPPVPLFASQSQTRPPFNFLFIGGLPRATRTKRKGKKAEKRMPLYVSNIPPLKGCIRGMLIDGEKLDLREMVENGSNILGRIEGVQIGCEQIGSRCEEFYCQNEGKCQVNWHLAEKSVQCDCSTTSFRGQNCTEDIGIEFPGHSSIIFDLAHPKRFSFLGDSERQTLSFSFKTLQNDGSKWPQQLATIYFEDGHQIHIQLSKNNGTSFLAFGIFPKNGSSVPFSIHKFEGANFTDGHRHFFRAHFFARKSPLIMLDGWRHQFNRLEGPLNLANAKIFYFGGKAEMEEEAEGSEEMGKEIENINNEKSEENEKIGTKFEAENESTTTMNELKEKVEQAENNQPNIVNVPEQILLSDAMREIMAKRRRATMMNGGNGTVDENNEIVEEKGEDEKEEDEDKRNGGEDETKWPKMVYHFEGIISNVAIEFERESSLSPFNVLRFTPLLYYLQEEEFLHRSVRTDPLDLPGGKLLPASAGPFRLPPKPIPPPPRIVQVPNWEAPLRRVPFPDWDPFSMNAQKESDQFGHGQESQTNNSHIWIVSMLLIFLLLMAICCCCCFCVGRKRRTTESAEFFDERTVEGKPEKKPMLGKIKLKENGIGEKRALTKEEEYPIQLRLQRPLKSPPPTYSPIKIPKVNGEFTDPAQVKPPRSILRTPGQRKKTPPAGPIKIPDHFERIPAGLKAQCDESAASSSGTTAYFTANDHFVGDSSATSSFVSLEQPDPPTNVGSDDSSIIGANANDGEDEDDGFGEKAPSELMDEKMLELANGGGDALFDESSSSSTSSIQLPPSSPSQNGPSFANSSICAAPETPETLTAASRAEGEEEAEEQSTLNISGQKN